MAGKGFFSEPAARKGAAAGAEPARLDARAALAHGVARLREAGVAPAGGAVEQMPAAGLTPTVAPVRRDAGAAQASWAERPTRAPQTARQNAGTASVPKRREVRTATARLAVSGRLR